MGAINHLICLPVQVMKIFYLRNFDVSAFYQNSRRYDQRIFADDNKSCDLVIAPLAKTTCFKKCKISDKNLPKQHGRAHSRGPGAPIDGGGRFGTSRLHVAHAPQASVEDTLLHHRSRRLMPSISQRAGQCLRGARHHRGWRFRSPA